MNRARAITAVIALSLSSLGLPAAWAADPASEASAAQPDVSPSPSRDDARPTEPAGIQKTKTRSNQSNDRTAAPSPSTDAPDTEQPAEVLKTKTKSNQSND